MRERAQRGGIEALRQEDPGYMLRMEKLLPELLQDRRVQAEMDAIRQEPGNEHLTKDDVALANEWFRRKLEKLTPEELAKLESKEGKATWEGILWRQFKDSVQLQMREAGGKPLSDAEIQKLAVTVPQAQQEAGEVADTPSNGLPSHANPSAAHTPSAPDPTTTPGSGASVLPSPQPGAPMPAANPNGQANSLPPTDMASESSRPNIDNPQSNDTLPHDQQRTPRSSSTEPAQSSFGIIARDVLGRDRGNAAKQPPAEYLHSRENQEQRATEYRRLQEWSDRQGLRFDPDRLGARISGYGEHDVHISSSSNPNDQHRVFKQTRPGYAGLTARAIKDIKGDLRIHQDDATLGEYMDRMTLHNELFGDTLRFEGVVETEHGPAAVISQPFIRGTHPSAPEIEAALKDMRWLPTGDGKWQKRHEGQVIGLTDIKESNWIRTPEGKIVPIDVIPFVATEAMIQKWPALPEEE